MSNGRRQFLTSVLGALLAIASLAGLVAHQAEAKDPPQTRVEGKLTAKNVTARRVSVRLQNGTIRVLSIPATAKIERNGVRVGLNAFKINDAVQARLLTDGVTVIKFEGVGP